MWHWDQGRLEYFQFDVLRRAAQFCLHNDLSQASRGELQAAIGLSFDPPHYSPWRNYARVFKSMFLVAGTNAGAVATPVAAILAVPGQVTCDEYFHFVAQASTEPSPALSSYNFLAEPRYPLLFCLKFLLTKAACKISVPTGYDELIGAYHISGFRGDEGQTEFLTLMGRKPEFAAAGKSCPEALRRQARESLRVISQISYLHIQKALIYISLDSDDALDAFNELSPIGGGRQSNANAEIDRRAAFFKEGSNLDFFDYPRTVVSEVVQAGFDEGGKVEKTHLIIERNAQLRQEYFRRFDPRICDVCQTDTRRTYPWTKAVIDLHHKLPLSSGTRVERDGTVLSDLVPVCPTCHRAVHRFYGVWLRENGQRDFLSADQAHLVYDTVKQKFSGHKYAS